MKKNHFYRTFLLFTLLFPPIFLNSQYNELIDSLEQHNSIERCRIVLGYIEKDKIVDEKLPPFLNIIEKYAQSKNDRNLQKEVDFFRLKKKRVFTQPKENTVEALSALLQEYEQKNEPLFVGYCLHEIAQHQFQNKEYGLSFENSFKAYHIFEEIGFQNVPSITKFLHDLALNHYFFRDYEQVIKLMEISITLPPFSPNLDMQRYNNMGMAYARMHKKDSAIYFLNKAYDLSLKYDSEIWQGITLGNIGDTYYHIDSDYIESLKYFKKQYELEENYKIKNIEIQTIINMCKVYTQLDSLDKAKMYLDKFEAVIKTLKPKYLGDLQQFETLNVTHFQTKIGYLKKIGDYKNVMIYNDSLTESKRFLDETYNKAYIKITADKLQIQEKELALAKEKERRGNQKIVFIGSTLGILLIAGITFVLLYLSKIKKQRENELLHSQNLIAKLEKEKIKKELELAKKNIDQFLKRINEQNQLVERIKKDLTKLERLEHEEKQLVNEPLLNLKNVRILTDEDWINFQQNFKKVFPELMSALKEHSPSITTSEMRYLMLTQLNLSHKEMANALGVSNDAIRVTWNRVRKKLNGTLEDTPQILIQRILKEHHQLIEKQ